jgi:hypothetical protein
MFSLRRHTRATIMDMKEITKDNMKVIMDLALDCDRRNMKLKMMGSMLQSLKSPSL